MKRIVKNKVTMISDEVLLGIHIGFEWFPAERINKIIVHDIDLCALVLNGHGKIDCDEDFVFYNNLTDSAHVVRFNDFNYFDKRVDDTMIINLKNAKSDTEKIIIFALLHEADSRMQSFAQLTAFYMYTNIENNIKIPIIFDELPASEVMLLSEFTKDDDAWYFKSTGSGYRGSIFQFLKNYGLEIE